jgi:hypothetical protein
VPRREQQRQCPGDLVHELQALATVHARELALQLIRELFDRQAFEQMVKTGYPEIAQSASAHVTESRVEPDGHVHLRLKIRGQNGKNIEALYDMIWEDGRFRINGVVAKPDLGLV